MAKALAKVQRERRARMHAYWSTHVCRKGKLERPHATLPNSHKPSLQDDGQPSLGTRARDACTTLALAKSTIVRSMSLCLNSANCFVCPQSSVNVSRYGCGTPLDTIFIHPSLSVRRSVVVVLSLRTGPSARVFLVAPRAGPVYTCALLHVPRPETD